MLRVKNDRTRSRGVSPAVVPNAAPTENAPVDLAPAGDVADEAPAGEQPEGDDGEPRRGGWWQRTFGN